MGAGGRSATWNPYRLRLKRRMQAKAKTKAAIGLVACVAALAALAWPGAASGAKWVVKGRGWGHGVGMSQYGALGLAQHGRGYRRILHHYYSHTRIGHAGSQTIKVLLGSGSDAVRFTKARKACGKRLRRERRYRFERSGSDVILRRARRGKIANCGRSGIATGGGSIRIGGKGVYRGKLKAKISDGGLLVINPVGLEAYVRGVIPNEVSSSWPKAALRAQAVAARSYALATSGEGDFDVYDDARSQVYGGKGSETERTNRAARRTRGRVVRHRRKVATTYFFSTSGGQTESVQYGFPGSHPVPYLKSVPDPYDQASPYHRWTARFSQDEIESRLSKLFSGRLRKIRVLERGESPRIVTARVVGSRGSSKISGLGLQARLDLRSTWARFLKR
jgi:stage II sporulation protein D